MRTKTQLRKITFNKLNDFVKICNFSRTFLHFYIKKLEILVYDLYKTKYNSKQQPKQDNGSTDEDSTKSDPAPTPPAVSAPTI